MLNRIEAEKRHHNDRRFERSEGRSFNGPRSISRFSDDYNNHSGRNLTSPASHLNHFSTRAERDHHHDLAQASQKDSGRVWSRIRPAPHITTSSSHSANHHSPQRLTLPTESLTSFTCTTSRKSEHYNESTPRSRRLALERLSQQKAPALQRLGGASNEDSGRLQDIEIQYIAETNQPSYSNTTPRDIHQPGSPLAKTQIPVTITISRNTKALGKQKSRNGGNKRKMASSPLQGASSRKRNATRGLNPTKRRLGMDNPGPSGSLPCTRDEFQGTAFTKHFTNHPQGLSGGLVLLWNENVEIQVLSSSPNYI
ncbi:unnamed protein product [Arabis nemorensis]|uniref:Uncharacterized protein n=1 Tax=Arabis nemorensis TaxID=586526 RepID=A0A565C411_9BRAS|nr:unnamed protein product [Arabis nemorensis]